MTVSSISRLIMNRIVNLIQANTTLSAVFGTSDDNYYAGFNSIIDTGAYSESSVLLASRTDNPILSLDTYNNNDAGFWYTVKNRMPVIDIAFMFYGIQDPDAEFNISTKPIGSIDIERYADKFRELIGKNARLAVSQAITGESSSGGGTTTTVLTADTTGLVTGKNVHFAGTTNYNGDHTVSGIVPDTSFVIDTAYVADDGANGTWLQNLLLGDVATLDRADVMPIQYDQEGNVVLILISVECKFQERW
jgi:hypothetical protein